MPLDHKHLGALRRTIALGVFLVAGLATSTAHAATCSLYASPSGSDHGNGSLSQPFQSLSKLDWALSPGQTGCLRAGTYGSISADVLLDNSGSADGQITITAAPGEHAKVKKGSCRSKALTRPSRGSTSTGFNSAYDTERSGTHCPYPISNGLEIDGKRDIFEHNDFYQSVASLRGNGIGVGWNHPADGSIIRYNRIHDVGQCKAYDHLIYLGSGSGVQIYGNWMWNDRHGWGVQVYPQAHDAHIYDNVIDSAGSGFIVSGDPVVSNNLIEHNIVVNSTGLVDAGLGKGVGISDYWQGSAGTGNVFQHNDCYGNSGGVSAVSHVRTVGNATSNPQFVNAAAHDYRLASTSPAASWESGTARTARPRAA